MRYLHGLPTCMISVPLPSNPILPVAIQPAPSPALIQSHGPKGVGIPPLLTRHHHTTLHLPTHAPHALFPGISLPSHRAKSRSPPTPTAPVRDPASKHSCRIRVVSVCLMRWQTLSLHELGTIYYVCLSHRARAMSANSCSIYRLSVSAGVGLGSKSCFLAPLSTSAAAAAGACIGAALPDKPKRHPRRGPPHHPHLCRARRPSTARQQMGMRWAQRASHRTGPCRISVPPWQAGSGFPCVRRIAALCDGRVTLVFRAEAAVVRGTGTGLGGDLGRTGRDGCAAPDRRSEIRGGREIWVCVSGRGDDAEGEDDML